MTSLNGASNAACDASRQHSESLIKDAKSWACEIDATELHNPISLKTLWMPRLERISGEAVYLGFTRVSHLCRAVKAAVTNIEMSDTGLSAPKSDLLRRAFWAIMRLIEKSDVISTLDLTRLIDELTKHFGITQTAIDSPVLSGNVAVSNHVRTESNPSDDATHHDMNVYQNSRLDSLDRCSQEESWIVSQLASLAEDLASGNHAAHPANRLLHVLRGHKFFNQVDRVCLAGRVAAANQLVVVDAAISDRCEENSLKKGYSCFVNPNGSLFKMKPGTVRIFGDSEMVLKSFATNGKPAQRSIALIADQGLRSGLCLAIGRGSNIQGFLFLNSSQQELFQSITINSAPLLSLFGLVGTIALDSFGFHGAANPSGMIESALPQSSTTFENKTFANLVSTSISLLMKNSQILISVNRDSEEQFLYLPRTVVPAIAELVVRLNQVKPTGDLEFSIDVSRVGSEIHLTLNHEQDPTNDDTWQWMTKLVNCQNDRSAHMPIRMVLNRKTVAVCIPYEPLLYGDKQLGYSIVH